MNTNQFDKTVHYQNQRIGQPNNDIVLFAELLRELGLNISVSQILDASKALLYIDIFDRLEVLESLKCTLTRSPEEQAIFTDIFPAFWRDKGEGEQEWEELTSQTGSKNEKTKKKDDKVKQFMFNGYSQLMNETEDDGGKHSSFSPLGVSHSEPNLNTDPLSAKMKQNVHSLVRVLQSRYSRRRKKSNKGDQIYFRNMFRENMKYGGEPLDFSWTIQKKSKVQLVTICDVSTSMNPFTSFLLKFLHSVTQIVPHTETAIFNVKMAFISTILKIHSFEIALQKINEVSIGLSGGTRIGESLFLFNKELKRRNLANQQTIAIIFSDGWDVGDTHLLQSEMRKLRSSVSRVIWLHPYAHVAGFKPEVEGLKVSVPFIDDLIPFNGPSSINTLVKHLNGMIKKSRRG